MIGRLRAKNLLLDEELQAYEKENRELMEWKIAYRILEPQPNTQERQGQSADPVTMA